MQPETAALEQYVQELATQFVLGGGHEDGPNSIAQMLATLGRISETARAAGSQAVVDASGELTRKLKSANGGGPERKAVQSSIEALQLAIGTLAAGPAAAPSTNNFGSLAQDLDLVSDFMVEAREHLGNVETQLLAIEQDPSGTGPLQSLFRSFHTIKGLAGFLEFHEVQAVCHEVETLLDRARNNELEITSEITDLLLESADYLTHEIARIESCILGNGTAAAASSDGLLGKVRAVLEGRAMETDEAVEQAPVIDAPPETVEAEVEAVPPPPVSTVAPAIPMPAVVTANNGNNGTSANNGKQLRGDRLVKVDTGKLDYLVDMVGELVVAQSLIRHDPAFKSTTDMRLQRNLLQLGAHHRRSAAGLHGHAHGADRAVVPEDGAADSRSLAKTRQEDRAGDAGPGHRDGPQHGGGAGRSADAHGAQRGGPRHRNHRGTPGQRKACHREGDGCGRSIRPARF